MIRSNSIVMGVAPVAMIGGMAFASDDDDKVDAAGLAKALPAATVSLEQGLKASEAKGKPISAKFEVEDGALQLSIYTMSGRQFFEVVVDRKSGKIAKTEEIKEGKDLKEAKEQGKAMEKATSSLEAASAEAVKANAGYRVVSVEAELKKGHPVADVTLMKGNSVKHANQKLD